MKVFQNARQVALAYAAFKELERLVKDNDQAQLPPGFSMDVSGQEITIKIPPGTVISREKGTNGDGTIRKAATQNLYGYAVWACFLERLRKFSQHRVVMDMILDAMRAAMKRPGKTTEDELKKVCPDFAKAVETLRQTMDIPDREESTPRSVKRENDKLLPTITFNSDTRKAVA